jgi:hypothetical protein
MDAATRRNIKVALTVVCLAWVGWASWDQFSDLSDDDVQNHGSAAVQERMARECEGSFKQRYDCKERIVIRSGQQTFMNMLGRFAVISVPPALAWLAFSFLFPKSKVRERHVFEDPDAWKHRAEMHTHMDKHDTHHGAPGHHRRDPDADDWRKAALQGQPDTHDHHPAPAHHHDQQPEEDPDAWKRKAEAHTHVNTPLHDDFEPPHHGHRRET